MNIQEHYSKGYRFYIIDGVAYPSNTSILKLFNKEKIQDWAIKHTIRYIKEQNNLSDKTLSNAVNYAKQYLSELADTGTDKHKLATDFLQYNTYIKDKWLDKFIEWKEKEKFITNPRLVEKFLYSSKYRIAGRVDLMGKIMGEYIGVDIKTSSGIFNTHKMQCCGYDLMLKTPIRWSVLNIPRDASKINFKIITPQEKSIYTSCFLHLNGLFQDLWKNGDLRVDVAY